MRRHCCSPSRRDRSRCSTFGSPLRRLYAQNFPAYFSHTTLSAVHDRPWINMWALTDPIGSWVFDPTNRSLGEALRTVDWRLLDVGSLDRKDDGTFPAICGHSGFWTRAEYERAFAKLQDWLLPDGASATLSQNPAPPAKIGVPEPVVRVGRGSGSGCPAASSASRSPAAMSFERHDRADRPGQIQPTAGHQPGEGVDIDVLVAEATQHLAL